jgi:arylsulfatase A-like enzyme
MAEQRLDRRSFLAGAAGVATAGAQVPEASGRPNILHIMTDQQQWATIAGRSGCRTPNIDRLREGLLFERNYTPSAVVRRASCC